MDLSITGDRLLDVREIWWFQFKSNYSELGDLPLPEPSVQLKVYTIVNLKEVFDRLFDDLDNTFYMILGISR